MLPDAYEISTKNYPYTGKLDITGSKHPARYSNNEFNAGNGRYMVSLYDKVSGKTVLGFEDGGDNDYKGRAFLCGLRSCRCHLRPRPPDDRPGDEVSRRGGRPLWSARWLSRICGRARAITT